MTIYEFNYLDCKEQYDILVDQAVIVSWKIKDCHYILFALNGIYVEMRLIPYFNTVERITAFEDDSELDLYLEDIDISGLLKEVNI
jgi:hypothetical protein